MHANGRSVDKTQKRLCDLVVFPAFAARVRLFGRSPVVDNHPLAIISSGGCPAEQTRLLISKLGLKTVVRGQKLVDGSFSQQAELH